MSQYYLQLRGLRCRQHANHENFAHENFAPKIWVLPYLIAINDTSPWGLAYENTTHEIFRVGQKSSGQTAPPSIGRFLRNRGKNSWDDFFAHEIFMGTGTVRNFMGEIFMHENIMGEIFISWAKFSFSSLKISFSSLKISFHPWKFHFHPWKFHAHDFFMHETFRTGALFILSIIIVVSREYKCTMGFWFYQTRFKDNMKKVFTLALWSKYLSREPFNP